MIWLLILAASIGICAYIAAPLYLNHAGTDDMSAAQTAEISVYRATIKTLEVKIAEASTDSPALSQEKAQLERRLLASAVQSSAPSLPLSKSWIAISAVSLIAGTLGIYALIGSPELSDASNLKTATLSAPHAMSQNAQEVQHENNASMNDLVAGLEAKLKAGDDSPQSWGLYARSLMTLNRFEDAFAAYERTLELTQNNPDIAAELESARAFAAQQSQPAAQQPAPRQTGPSRADIEAAQSMSVGDRAAMIEGMVEGLSSKLADNPDDPLGWVRLLRARKVLGQDEAAQKEIKRLKAHFEQSPETIDRILNQSGWTP